MKWLRFISIFLVPVTAISLAMSTSVKASFDHPGGYTRLVEFIMQEDVETPSYPFNDFTADDELSGHENYLEYLNGQQGLLDSIYSGLGTDEVQWRLANISHRLLYVPETRKEYARLYEEYCRDMIAYVLDETQSENPYRLVSTLSREKPEIAYNGEGVAAFLVHNLIKESAVTYIFSNTEGKKLQVELSGKTLDGTVGSYSTDIHILDNGQFKFQRKKYTIWQNSATNPYTALMVPAEETLHIVLRGYTEKVIKAVLEQRSFSNLNEIKEVVDEWISVEEAIVGGLVHTLIQDKIRALLSNRTSNFIDADLKNKVKMKRYHYLEKGIGIVKQLGHLESIKMYKEDPRRFRELLLS